MRDLKGAWYTGTVVLLSFLIVILSNLLDGAINYDTIRVKCLWLLVIYVFYIIAWIKTTGSVYSIFFFFLLYTMLSNAGQLIITALGIDFESTVDVLSYNASLLNKAIDFQILSISMFCVFGLISWHVHHIREPFDLNEYSIPKQQSNEIIDISGIAFLVLAAVSFVLNLLKLESRVDQSYGQAFADNTSASYVQIIKFLYYIALFVSLNKHRSKGDKLKKFIVLIALVVGVTEMIYGSRSVLIPLICGIVFMFSTSLSKIGKLRKLGIAIIAIIGVVVLNSFASLRQMSLSEMSMDIFFETLLSENIFDQFVSLAAEMGGSMRTLIHTISSIDSGAVTNEPTFLYTLLHGILPGQILDLIGFSQPEHWRLAYWITSRYGGLSGWGYSMTAEAYFNFGSLGFLFFAVFGYVYEWAECYIRKLFMRGKPVIAAAWLFVISYMIFLARADSCLACTYIRYAFYVTIVAVVMKNVKIRIK